MCSSVKSKICKEGGLDIDQEEEENVVQWPTQAELMMVIAEQKVVCHAL